MFQPHGRRSGASSSQGPHPAGACAPWRCGQAPGPLRNRPGMKQDLANQRVTALFAVALLAFNFPLLALWDRDLLLWGVPLFPAALFIVWALLIAVLAWIMESLPD